MVIDIIILILYFFLVLYFLVDENIESIKPMIINLGKKKKLTIIRGITKTHFTQIRPAVFKPWY